MREQISASGYRYANAANSHAHGYLLPTVKEELAAVRKRAGNTPHLFDLGCGNGSVGAHLAELGWSVTGVDPSSEGIAQARKAYPKLRFEEGSAYDDLAAKYGRFPVVISLEVVEHVYAPRDYARTLFDLVAPGGTAIGSTPVSTPYHGYLKNLALALTRKMDRHFTALWEHGHIKFWSIQTFAKSMVAVAEKPPV